MANWTLNWFQISGVFSGHLYSMRGVSGKKCSEVSGLRQCNRGHAAYSGPLQDSAIKDNSPTRSNKPNNRLDGHPFGVSCLDNPTPCNVELPSDALDQLKALKAALMLCRVQGPVWSNGRVETLGATLGVAGHHPATLH